MISMRIGSRLTISYGLLLGLLFTVAAVSYFRFMELASVTRNIVEIQTRRAFLAQEANQHAQAAANYLFKLLLTAERSRRVQLYGEMDAELAASDDAVAEIAKTVQSPDDVEQLKTLNSLRGAYDDSFRETVEMIELSGPTAAQEHYEAFTKKALDKFLSGSLSVAATERQTMREDLAQLQEAQTQAQTLLIALSLGALFAGLALAAFMTRSIVRPVLGAIGVAESIANGDLIKGVPVGGEDEVGNLLRALDVMHVNLMQREDKILRIAYEDSLTGLANRTKILELLGTQSTTTSGAVLVLNIDRFGLINDALGHAVGDSLLRKIGQRLQHVNEVAPQWVARLWGDEFAFLLEGRSRESAEAAAQAISALLRAPVIIDGQRIDVSGTLGIALYPEDGQEPNALLRRAALAMRWAKQRYMSHAFVSEAAAESPHENLSLIGEMRDALHRQEFVVYYQPKFSFEKNLITGAEALLRWNHPSRGMVPPGQFIPFAEQTGFIREITPWLIEKVIREAVKWSKHGLAMVFSINLSALDLLNPGLVGYISGLLRQYGLPPELLCLEITESALIQDPALALQHLDQLSALGLKLSIDDYGTGQASLAYLKTLPVNELKIDRAFVTDITSSPKNAAIVRSTVILCHELGLSVVAEGSETPEELNWLRESGCDLVQGYVIGRPMPSHELVDWVAAYSACVQV
ncbi:MAG: EAL domain-containing protein [Burkholderiaceae bacterium]|nr:EAL domain-containing protein [Burkholderiaceae bacterium]